MAASTLLRKVGAKGRRLHAPKHIRFGIHRILGSIGEWAMSLLHGTPKYSYILIWLFRSSILGLFGKMLKCNGTEHELMYNRLSVSLYVNPLSHVASHITVLRRYLCVWVNPVIKTVEVQSIHHRHFNFSNAGTASVHPNQVKRE